MIRSKNAAIVGGVIVLIILGMVLYFFIQSQNTKSAMTGEASESFKELESAEMGETDNAEQVGEAVLPVPSSDTQPAPAELVPPTQEDVPAENQNDGADEEQAETDSEDEEIDNEESTDDEQVMCTADVMECSDGSYVSRVAPSCEFAACPAVQQLQFTPPTVACSADAKQCPDGSYVSRVAPDCEFAACPATQMQLQMGN